MAATYEDRFRAGLEPDSIDKEFLRRWYVARCDPYAADALPEAPSELVNELARRYDCVFYYIYIYWVTMTVMIGALAHNISYVLCIHSFIHLLDIS